MVKSNGGKVHNFCTGICNGPCEPCGNCLDCDDCECECDCTDDPPPCDCWNDKCRFCGVTEIPNSAPGTSANPHGAPFEARQIPSTNTVRFILAENWFNIYDSVVMIRGQGTWYPVQLDTKSFDQTVSIPANNTTHVKVRLLINRD